MIRIYGHSVGESSFAQVTRGMERAAKSCELWAGTVPVDHINDYATYDGRAAAMSLSLGSPGATVLAHRMGQHKRHWLLLAPNGETLPPSLVEGLTFQSKLTPNGAVDGLLAPSRWAVEVLKRHFPALPVRLAPHGISPGVHHVRTEHRRRARADYDTGHQFRVLHMTSTGSDRKSTRALITAWASLTAQRLLPRDAVLLVIADPHTKSELQWFPPANADNVTISVILGASQDAVANMYSVQHIVCQPSRAEGFGLAPLESLACGVPIVATMCTGHSEYFTTALLQRGVAIPVNHGPNSPLNEFEGALAPEVTVDAIERALRAAHANWKLLDEAARDHAGRLAEEWSWEAKNREVLRLCAAEAAA